MPTPARLDADRRAAAWERLGSTKFDVLIIGGGVTGSGAALDAATRGLSVALVEARDFASGTSSRSSKLFHGGLRYLEQFNFGLVREALRERELMLTRIAPHLVKPVSFLYPLTHRIWERPYVSAGMTLYDSMGGARSVPRHRHFTRGDAVAKGQEPGPRQLDDRGRHRHGERARPRGGCSVGCRALNRRRADRECRARLPVAGHLHGRDAARRRGRRERHRHRVARERRRRHIRRAGDGERRSAGNRCRRCRRGWDGGACGGRGGRRWRRWGTGGRTGHGQRQAYQQPREGQRGNSPLFPGEMKQHHH